MEIYVKKIDPYMFDFASYMKLWIKLANQMKQTKKIVGRTSYKKHHWNYKQKEIHKSRNYLKYSMILLPSVLKSQIKGNEDYIQDNIKSNKTYQMKTFNMDKKLGFISVASIETLHSIIGWSRLVSNVHTKAELKKGNDDKEPSKNYVNLTQEFLTLYNTLIYKIIYKNSHLMLKINSIGIL